jgi:hypothetical protein
MNLRLQQAVYLRTGEHYIVNSNNLPVPACSSEFNEDFERLPFTEQLNVCVNHAQLSCKLTVHYLYYTHTQW